MDYTEYFKKIIKDIPFGRFGKTFASKNNKYFYDAGTGKVLQCEDAVYLILQQLEHRIPLSGKGTEISETEYIRGLEILAEAVEKENILQAPPIKEFTGNQLDCLEDSLKNNVQHLCMELTQNCNLRCEYCIYQNDNQKFRNFDRCDLDIEIAKKAIDYTLMNANDQEVHFGFYGGEPLLKFVLIKQCVEYILKIEKKRNVFFSMTTNGTLMTKDKAQYFASIPNFSIVFSLDGDEKTHNSKRKMENGEGSFSLAFTGFQNTKECYGEKAIERLLINAVVCPPFDEKKFDKMQDFFEANAKNHQIQYSYVDYGPQKDKEDRENNHISSPILEWTKKSVDRKSLFSWGGMTQGFLQIHKRPISEKPIEMCRFNGCCVPGSRRIYLTAQGKYKVCERVGEAPDIGSVDTGIEIDTIKNVYVDSYMKESIDECKNCWMRNMCGVCYASCYDKNGLNINQKHKVCESQRYITEEMMKFYHEILEENPESLEYLNEIVIK